MTPQEKLKEIEDKLVLEEDWIDIYWLVARIKQLEATLEIYRDNIKEVYGMICYPHPANAAEALSTMPDIKCSQN